MLIREGNPDLSLASQKLSDQIIFCRLDIFSDNTNCLGCKVVGNPWTINYN